MDFSTKASDVEESLVPGVFEIPAEPAVVINGLPPISSTVDAFFPFPKVNDAESHKDAGFGQWFEGRKVRKLFGDKYYNGEVTEFDGEIGRSRVKYENGDVEDLEWHELEQVLQPLDINIPLKTLATNVINRKKGFIKDSGKSQAGTTNQGVKNN